MDISIWLAVKNRLRSFLGHCCSRLALNDFGQLFASPQFANKTSNRAVKWLNLLLLFTIGVMTGLLIFLTFSLALSLTIPGPFGAGVNLQTLVFQLSLLLIFVGAWLL